MNKKTIWITGGSTGIGKALAIKFASKGWNVAVSARRNILLDELSKRYENISGFQLDVTDTDGNNLSYTLINSPSNGTATITDGVLTYTSANGFTGSDTISFKAN